MNNFRFDSETHTYWMDNRKLPGVTGILTDAGLINTDWFQEEHANRGTAVHTACLYWLQNDLDEESLDPQLAGYLEGFKEFMHKSGFSPEMSLVEKPRYDALKLFAGTPDLPGYMNSLPVIIDIKSGGVYPYHALQLAAYKILLRVNGFQALKRYVLQLRPNGSSKLHEFKDINDEGVFLAALTLYQWKYKNGGK
ncbi:MAG: hypothetical protein HZA08_07410 [Nitrospirae bacterium]|nr:hypothetical protein [Nitrospirota bacterium]